MRHLVQLFSMFWLVFALMLVIILEKGTLLLRYSSVFIYKKQLLCVVGILTMVSISRSGDYTWCKIQPAIQFQSGDSQSGILHCFIWPWLKAKWVKYYWEEIFQNCLLCTLYGLHPLVFCLKTTSGRDCLECLYLQYALPGFPSLKLQESGSL